MRHYQFLYLLEVQLTKKKSLTFPFFCSNIYKDPHFALLKSVGTSLVSLPPIAHCSYLSLSPLASRNEISLFAPILIQKYCREKDVIQNKSIRTQHCTICATMACVFRQVALYNFGHKAHKVYFKHHNLAHRIMSFQGRVMLGLGKRSKVKMQQLNPLQHTKCTTFEQYLMCHSLNV